MLYSTEKKKEKAILIGTINKHQDKTAVKEFLDELAFLTETGGAIPVRCFTQYIEQPNPHTFIGKGKVEEIKNYILENKIDLAIFDDEISTSQHRNIEKEFGIRILDRTGLILDIFASRAKTAYSKTQVEMAQYQYLLSHLVGMWTHLERQRGGIGLRGPGETELETDRRRIREKISLLKEKLENIDKQMITQRKNRGELIRVALVGYTNVGKSTLMNLLSKTEVFAENKLFATLDTTVKKVVIGQVPFLLSDTVGFIRKLPHLLVESFKSTLDEVRESDILLHVVDISHSNFEEQIKVVKETLVEITAADKFIITVFNKIDVVEGHEEFVPLLNQNDNEDVNPLEKRTIALADLKKSWIAKISQPSIFISAHTKENIDELKTLLHSIVKEKHMARYPNKMPY
ncbi:MAG: GTPase HflX [Bacteroidota bacterium]